MLAAQSMVEMYDADSSVVTKQGWYIYFGWVRSMLEHSTHCPHEISAILATIYLPAAVGKLNEVLAWAGARSELAAECNSVSRTASTCRVCGHGSGDGTLALEVVCVSSGEKDVQRWHMQRRHTMEGELSVTNKAQRI